MPSPSQQTSFALGLDLGGTKVEAALVDEHGTVLTDSRFRLPTGPATTPAGLEAAVTSLVTRAVERLPEGASLVGAGIGSAGPVVAATGTVSPLNMAGVRDFPLRALVQSVLPDLPVRLRIDGLCITLAEHWVGAGRGVDNLMGMIVSTGVGGGLILGGRTIAGPSGNAGHIGHVEVAGFDDPCACGGRGCLEAVASGPKTVAWARSHGWTGHTGEELAAAHATGDPIAVRAVERSGRALGQAIASATNLLDLDVVAIGGGFSHVSPDLFENARAAIARRVVFDFATKVRLVPSALSGEGPLIGAAALIHRAALVAEPVF
ncbi:ROK family protein [Glaciibacter psychrotolerans]|uniref:Glucokinase n=1 Tax=Glaciibacter psychrotolerans TaxID=670054 RepID=A0A7Z0EE71_9MICO|nr:ROK family protein [Leifsonia psychrotolerans]NYJ20013.1 glucokinase [Leifsonia psychrotolerans]